MKKKISILSNYKYMVVILSVIIFLIYDYSTAFSYIHEEVYNDQDDWYITVENKIVVPPTILDYEIKLPYMFGLRLDVNTYNCDIGKRKMIDRFHKYFVLDLRNGHYFSFESQLAFDRKLDEIDISLDEYELNYSMFKYLWDFYSLRYRNKGLFSKCDMENPEITDAH